MLKLMETSLHPVDRLEIRVLVDNVTDSLSTNPEHIHSELHCHAMSGGLTSISGKALCCAHHGLSLVIRAEAGDTSRTLLFDAGPEAATLSRNGDRLAIDFGGIDATVLSHGHWDHGGGLLEAIRLIRQARPAGDLPSYLHPGMFHQRAILLPNGHAIPFEDVPTPAQLREAGAEPIVTDAATTALDGMFYVSGEIPRTTSYETGLPGHVARSSESDDWKPDPLIVDERFVAVHVRNRGLVVFTACSHAGLINTLTAARESFPDIPLHAAVGGFHLAGAAIQKIIPETVRDLAQFDLRWLIPSHCTGWRAVNALVNAFGEERVVPNAVGKRIIFAA
jgi:7,8-dihydropterin-6-yl-methyl-4-(beta-D-ribofuranosyl)aminobenzene 5'-phosphate synthase